MIKHFRLLRSLFRGNNSLKQAVGILFVTVLISNILGLLRNVIIANRVGVTYGSIGPLDNYFAAFVIPDLLYSIIIVGALASAILPLLVHIDESGNEKEFWRTYNVLLSTGLTTVIGALVVLVFMMPWLVARFFPGFSLEDQQFTVELSRILLLSPIFFTLSQISTSALQAKKLFIAPALAPIIYNTAIIIGALLIPRFGLPILVLGVIAGAAGHFLVQLPSLIKLGWHFSFEFGFKNPHVQRVVKLMVPRTIAITGTQLLLIVFYRLASSYQSGSIAIYRLTDDLQYAPVLLLANSLAMAILPDFTRRIARNKEEEYRELIAKALRLLVFVFLPVTLFMLIYRYQIIGLYVALGHSISSSEMELAVKTFSFFVISLFFQGTVLLLARAYFARGDTVHTTLFSIIGICVAWVLAVILGRETNLGVVGLAMAFSLGSTCNAVLLWSGLKIPFSTIFFDNQRRWNLAVVIIGGFLSAVAMWSIKQILPQLSLVDRIGYSMENALVILVGLAVGVAVYLVWARLFQLEQWRLIHSKDL